MYLIVIPLIFLFSRLLFDIFTPIGKIPFISASVILIASIGLLSFTLTDFSKGGTFLPNTSTIKIIKDLNLNDKPGGILEDEGGLFIFLKNYYWIPGHEKSTNFNGFLQAKDIKIIWITDKLLNLPSFSQDIEFQDFLKSYEKYSFKKIIIPNSSNYLLINENAFVKSDKP